MSGASSAIGSWLQGWWRSLGGFIRFVFIAIAVISACSSGYLGVNHYFNQKMGRALLPTPKAPQWEIRYPLYVYVGQTRLLEIYQVGHTPTLPTATSSSEAAETLVPSVLNVKIRPPLLRLLSTSGAISYYGEVDLRPNDFPTTIQMQNEGLGNDWFHRVVLQVRAPDTILSSEPISIYIEGPLGALLREVAQATLPFLLSAGVAGFALSSFRHYQKLREQRALTEFENLRASLRTQTKFPNNFKEQVEKLKPFATLLPAGEYRCLMALYSIYQASCPTPRTNSLEEELQFVESCPLEWVEALLLLWETCWPSRPRISKDASRDPCAPYRLLLRRLPRFRLSDEGAQRVKRLLRRAGAPQTQSPARWPPAAGQPCTERPHVHIANERCEGPREKQSRNPASAVKSTHRVSSLFPEGAALDARLPQTQAWLFGPTCALFWEHPSLITWRREAIKTPMASQTVRLVVGDPGSGRTTLALAVGRYLHGEEILGIYVDNPRHLRDIQHALARRLLTFLCVRAPDAWRLERGLREALLHLWLGIWPKAVLRVLLEESVEAWGNGTEKATGNASTSPPIAEIARVELRTWLRMLNLFEQPPPLTPEAWWQLAAEVVPALGYQVHRPPRGWTALWIALDLNNKEALANSLNLAAARRIVAPLARQIPTTWFAFQPRTDSPPSISDFLLEELTWSKNMLRQMLERRKQQLSLRKGWPTDEELEDMLSRVSTPRALGQRWLKREQRTRSSIPSSS